ncbi:alpha/beta-hydrolase [Fistulina hepatica ATCC 64428]|uniref:Carboxypeptidase n=1 Tax=Fistulina hepatica ATCC 64428 TaxID=1128425 RepID=A0A0D7AA30_9AGAR|nr:alpha/beta-hydrolase [Fistulina hepatica ATCC 64428]
MLFRWNLIASLLFLVVFAAAKRLRKDEMRARQLEAAQRVKRQVPANIVRHFYVNGTGIPFVHWDVGQSWAGLLPISGNANETRQLFFWYFPPGPEGSDDDLIFWTNGGPGCSSLEGFLEENGPISWGWGQAKPTQNEYSWTNLSHVIWVEQPVGTGFSQGTPDIDNEDELAAEVVGFLQQFLEVFSELKGKNFYVTGESYAGAYVPYIANYIYENPDELDLNLKGIWIADPVIGYDVVQDQVPAPYFVKKYKEVFAFTDEFMERLAKLDTYCGYTEYLDTYLTYPPAGPLPFNWTNTEADAGCDLWDLIFGEALVKNPAFDIYRIFDMPPVPWDVLGFPGSFEQVQVSPIYFDRQDVKEAIHAPLNVTWVECTDVNVFPNGDNSPPSAFSVLPNVIEKSNRTVIIHGLADFVLIAEGARLVIQKCVPIKQGFQTPIENETFILEGMGAMGTSHTERGLTYLEAELSGHMIPQFLPVAAYQSMQYLMGFRDDPSY